MSSIGGCCQVCQDSILRKYCSGSVRDRIGRSININVDLHPATQQHGWRRNRFVFKFSSRLLSFSACCNTIPLSGKNLPELHYTPHCPIITYQSYMETYHPPVYPTTNIPTRTLSTITRLQLHYTSRNSKEYKALCICEIFWNSFLPLDWV